MHRYVLAVLVMTSLCSCDQKARIAPAAGLEPAFDPVAFFDGHTRSRGVIEDRSGAPTEPIVTDSHATLDDANRLHMVQTLTSGDGTTQRRVWTLWRTGADSFEATANDMVGSAKGQSDGQMFHWQWILARSPGNPLMNVTMEQWMYGMQDGTVLIRTTVSKLGFIAAEVTEQFTRSATAKVAAASPG